MRPSILFIFACGLCAAATSASAQLYKWIDSSGGINYGDWPPAGAKLQPMNHGTLSSVDDRALVPTPARAPTVSRSAPRTGGPTITVRNEAASSHAPAAQDDADVVGAYAPYYGYARRPAVVAAEAERRPASSPVVRPMLPIDPAIPDMPLRPRR